MIISVDDFDKVELRVGTIVEASINRRARVPAYKLKVDMGPELGVKGCSAQITDNYTAASLIGRQALFVANFAPMRIGDAKSEVRILGASTTGTGERPGKYVLLNVDKPVANGSRVW